MKKQKPPVRIRAGNFIQGCLGFFDLIEAALVLLITGFIGILIAPFELLLQIGKFILSGKNEREI